MASWIYIERNSQLDSIVPDIMSTKAWAVDTETTGLCHIRNKPILLQIGRPEVQYLIDLRKVRIEPLREFFEREDYFLVGHNLKFDYKMLKAHHDIRMENLRDIYLGEKILLNGKQDWGFKLHDLMKKYLKKEKDLESQKSFVNHTGPFTERQLNYAASDVSEILLIQKAQTQKIKEDGLYQTYLLECNCIGCFGDMEIHGVRLDKEKWAEIADNNLKKAEAIKEEMDRFARMVDWPQDLFGNVDINYNAPEQILNLLRKMGVKVKQTRRDGSTHEELISGTNKKILKKVLHHNIVQKVIEYRKLTKRYGTYGYNFIDAIYPETGRIHCDIKQLGAETGRITSGEKKYDRKMQVNLLNIPRDKEMRHCFLAQDDDYVVETDDYSGAELRIWAHISQDPALVDAFNKNIDVHCMVASKLYGKTVEKSDPLRTPAKSLNFGRRW